MIQRGLNTVQTSSCGRLFDAVASIMGLRHEVNYEGQAAIELEMAVREGISESYPFEIGPAVLGKSICDPPSNASCKKFK